MVKISKLKIGVVGLGRIFTLNVLGYVENPDVGLYAFCDKDKKALQEASEKFGVKKTYTSYDEFLKDDELDLIDILTPHSQHEWMSVAAAEAGKHISLQKPPTLTLSSFDRIVRAVKKAGVKFRVFENFRFHPPYVRAMELVKNKEIGKVHAVNMRMWSGIKQLSSWKVSILKSWRWRYTERENYKMPTLFDDGYHKHSIIQWFLKDIKSVQAWKGNYKIYGILPIDSPSVVIYKGKKDERFGTWNASMTPFLPIHSDYYGCDEALEIHGKNGIAFIQGCTGKMFEGCTKGGPGSPGVYWLNKKGEWNEDTSMDTNWKYSFINCTKHYIDAIKNDTEVVLDAKTARYILQISLAMVKSLRTGSVDVRVDSIKDGIGDNLIQEDEDDSAIFDNIPENVDLDDL
ncbi:MAG: Gfo/Idh/MocA family protein [Candidatus Helarchaeota archaeon]